ncbi:hypothetical protein [Roseimaritima multifibrata]|uniref:hypothetical protein n=1 Tax=Roseimaritima multifibrata TaxID=1930274 RepID=UPI0011A2731B|nr:hypothetical protein [Roseimaritima multifibrata]
MPNKENTAFPSENHETKENRDGIFVSLANRLPFLQTIATTRPSRPDMAATPRQTSQLAD